MEQSFREIKILVDRIAAVDVTINDEETFLHIFNGLSAEFNTFWTSIRTRDTTLVLAELEVVLDAEAKAIVVHQSPSEPVPTTMTAF